MFDTKPYEEKMDAAIEHLQAELKKVRTGRAHASMLDGVTVEAYGTRMPLNQVANVSAPEAQMLLVSPFDPSQITAISAAIRDSQSLGFNPSDDGRVVRVPVPPLTEDRRRDMVKQVGEKGEDCRIALRNVRQEALQTAKRMKDDKKLSEDDVKAIEKGVDDDMKQYQAKIEQLLADKEQDIMTV